MATIVLGSQFGDEVMVLSISDWEFVGPKTLVWQRNATADNHAVGSSEPTAGD